MVMLVGLENVDDLNIVNIIGPNQAIEVVEITTDFNLSAYGVAVVTPLNSENAQA